MALSCKSRGLISAALLYPMVSMERSGLFYFFRFSKASKNSPEVIMRNSIIDGGIATVDQINRIILNDAERIRG